MAPATMINTGIPKMRYLLVTWSETASQWRCFDTSLFPIPIERAEDLPAALNAVPEATLRWLLARYEFGPVISSEPASDGTQMLVYELDTDRAPISGETDYLGAWLEMVMQSRNPVAVIALREAANRRSDSAKLLELRVEEPLRSSDPACQQTMDLIRDHGGPPPARPEIVQGLFSSTEKV